MHSRTDSEGTKPQTAIKILEEKNPKVKINLEMIPTADYIPKILAMAAGENSKSLGGLGRVLDFLADQKIDRRGVIFVVGGGVMGDLGGFAAATWLRGIDFYQVPHVAIDPAETPHAIDRKVAAFLRLPDTPVRASDWFWNEFDARRQAGTLSRIIQIPNPNSCFICAT